MQKEIPAKPELPQFAPKVNPTSSEIDKRSKIIKEDGKPIERWELLYDLNEKKKSELEELKKLYEESDSNKNECTFKPQLVTEENKISVTPAQHKKKSVAGVQERAMIWQKRKEDKLRALKETTENKEMESCTFAPRLISKNSGIVQNEHIEDNKQSTTMSTDGFIASMKSVEKYIEKQKALREQRELSHKKAEQIAGSGNVWTKKITVPKAPTFTDRIEKDELKALSKVFLWGW